jgi:uncharacterized membrane protein YdbT with pleckstrin-like domain
MSYYPALEEILQSKTYPVLFKVRRSYRSILSNMAYFIIATIVVGVLNYFFANSAHSNNFPLRWLSIVPIIFLLNVFRNVYDKIYIFELHKIIEVSGRLSLNLLRPSANYVDVRAINVTQDIFGRILGYGTVYLGTAGADGYEIVLEGVRAPHDLAKLIDRLKTHSGEYLARDRAAGQDNGVMPTSTVTTD